MRYFIPLILQDPKKAIKMTLIGIVHGVLGKLGYIELG
jgi:hypothetical protein